MGLWGCGAAWGGGGGGYGGCGNKGTCAKAESGIAREQPSPAFFGALRPRLFCIDACVCRSSGFLYGRDGGGGGGGAGAASSVSTGASPLARWGDDGGGGTVEPGPENPTDGGGAGRLAEAKEVAVAVGGGWVRWVGGRESVS